MMIHDDQLCMVFFCKCILIIHLVIARHADQTYGTEFRVWVVLPSFQVNRQPCLHLGKLQVQCFLQGHWTVVDWGELINQWLEQIWWVYLPHMLVAKSFPNPLIDWCWCGSHVVPRSQMIGTPQGLSKSCLSTEHNFLWKGSSEWKGSWVRARARQGLQIEAFCARARGPRTPFTPRTSFKGNFVTGCTWHSTCHSAQVFQDRPCHEHTGSWTNHQVLRHAGWLLQGESCELIKKN